jgi:hypothetical protein
LCSAAIPCDPIYPICLLLLLLLLLFCQAAQKENIINQSDGKERDLHANLDYLTAEKEKWIRNLN